MKRMLFNATQQEELRVAIVNGQKLIDIDIETTGRELRKSNIYKGVITRIEPSLEACFVNYGEERHGFLPFKEVARTYFKEGIDVRNSTIKDALREGQEIIVQVEKEERGNKGAALTSFISLAGRYLVLMPNNPRGGGVSRRVEGEDRQELRETMDKLDLPSGMSVIARTAGIGRNVDELQWDLNYLMQLWRAIDGAGKSGQGAFLIYQESSLVIRAIRDYFQPDIGEILIDTDDIYEQAQQFMSHVMPDMVHRVKRYSDDVPLFSRFQIEHQIETAYSRTVPLPSGGAIVIDHTEALVSVDVNSARATRGGDIETTAFNTNCEAAEEVARQLRLRDLGGLIVIDFIDMENSKNQREVETRLKDALRFDRARVQMGKISRFGLMELSRQRLRPSLSEGSHVTCPRCNGTGHIRDTESSALQVLRIIQEEAMKENSAAIHVQVPVDVAAFLLNEKRGEILKIETRHRVTAILIPNKHLETPHYKLDRLKHDDPRLEEAHASYAMAEQVDTDIGYNKRQKDEVKPRQEAVVKSITPDTAPIVERKPAPSAKDESASSEGLFAGIAKFFSKLFGASEEKTVKTEDKPKQGRDRHDRNRQRNRGRNGRDGRDGRDGREARESREGREGHHGRSRNGNEVEAREERAANGNAQKAEKEARSANANSANDKGLNEARQSKSNKANREDKEGQEPRRERQPKQREQRKEQVQAEAASEELPVTLNTPASNAAPKAKLVEANEGDNVIETTQDAPTEEGRRRRRGGRNRNRRDRHANENQESLNAFDSADAKNDAPPAFIPVVDLLQNAKDVAPVQASFDLTPGDVPTSNAAPASLPLPVESTPVIASATDTPATADTPAATVEASDAAPVEVSAPITQAITTATETALPVVNEASMTTKTEVPNAAVENHQEPSPLSLAATPEALHDEVPTEEVTPVAHSSEPIANRVETVSTVATEVAQVSIADVSTTTVAITNKDQEVSLDAVLEKAGLILASTDPAKLKAAQEAAAQITAMPRVVRQRKPAPSFESEALVLVETKKN